jgi:purine-nucleoside phosphorylase
VSGSSATAQQRAEPVTEGGWAPRAKAAAVALRPRLGDFRPDIAVILGSGLGRFAERIEGAVRVPFDEIPGFPSTTVVGHAGALIAGTVDGRSVLALAGRFHMYEGHSAGLAGLPVRVMHALGARTLFVSNAAGGLRRTFQPGDLMVIEDHINMMWRSPLAGPLEPEDSRFPDMSDPYDRALRALLRECGRETGVRLVEGVYCGLLGPTYETPAEVRMLDRLGADAVGMSTVPEVVVAKALGMRAVGVSCITNLASGISPTKLDHAEVVHASAGVAHEFERLVAAFTRRLPESNDL